MDPAQPTTRTQKEQLLGQRGLVVWLYGLSGAGKSTLATALEHSLHAKSRVTARLDGDEIRSGLNAGLTFSVEDRMENIRRSAEMAKLLVNSGLITICSFITPSREMRATARRIVGTGDFLEVYLKCSFDTCAGRDVKGLYAKADAGQLAHFTGKDSLFEVPRHADLVLDTEQESPAISLARLSEAVESRIQLTR